MTMLTVLLLMVCQAVAIAAPKSEPREPGEPQDGARVDLERRVAELEGENAELRRRIEALERRLGAQPTAGEGTVVWTLELASDLKGSGCVADLDGDGALEIVFGTYFGDAHVYCVDAATGAIRWRHKSHGGPLDASTAAVDLTGDGKLEVLCADSASGHLYCLAHDGRLLWTIKLPSGTDSPPAVADLDGDGVLEIVVGTMWQRDGIGAVGCYCSRTQQLKWERRVPGCVQSEPALVDLDGDGVLDVVVTSWRGDRGIHAFSGKDGESLWTFITAGDEKSMGMYHGVAVGERNGRPVLFAATCQGDVYALDHDGNQVWHRHYDDYLFSPVTIGDVNGDGSLEIIFGGRSLYALRTVDGSELWPPVRLSAPMDRGVALADANGDGRPDIVHFEGLKAVAREGVGGTVIWSHDLPRRGATWEKISSAPLIADFDGDGTLNLFVVAGLGTSADEFRNNFGHAVALRLHGTGLGWRTFRGNLRRTGHAP